MIRKTGRAKMGEMCYQCGKEFREGERITVIYGEYIESVTTVCRNSYACEAHMNVTQAALLDMVEV